MRIAQVSPLIEPVPPPFYGGTERVVSFLTEELVRRGHEVTLFASGDSTTRARLRSVLKSSVRLSAEQPPDPVSFHILEIAEAFSLASDFDIIHCHLDYLGFSAAHFSGAPSVHTLHSRLDLPHWPPIIKFFHGVPLVSISTAQRRPVEEAGPNWIDTVYHGFPDSAFRTGSGKGGYLAYISRIARDKRPDLAIAVAKKVGLPIKLAGKIDPTDRGYFETEIKPLLQKPHIEYLGEIHDSEKADFLGEAVAFVFPLEWPEPFGMVVVESLACGTPVITRPFGAIPELVTHGVNGFIAQTVDEMAAAVRHINEIDRGRCSLMAREQFSVGKMTDSYEAVYEKVLRSRKK